KFGGAGGRGAGGGGGEGGGESVNEVGGEIGAGVEAADEEEGGRQEEGMWAEEEHAEGTGEGVREGG
ncbi:MAG: hypothetical protein Q9157_009201, partial [Trypethelium eluteriae]